MIFHINFEYAILAFDFLYPLPASKSPYTPEAFYNFVYFQKAVYPERRETQYYPGQITERYTGNPEK